MLSHIVGLGNCQSTATSFIASVVTLSATSCGKFWPMLLKKSVSDGARQLGETRRGGRRQALCWRCRGRHRDQLGELAEVLGGGCEVKLVACSGGASESQSVQAENAFEVGEEHFDLLALTS